MKKISSIAPISASLLATIVSIVPMTSPAAAQVAAPRTGDRGTGTTTTNYERNHDNSGLWGLAGLISPNQAARQGIKRELYWTVPFGFVAGYAFNWLTSIQILSVTDPIANHIIGGLQLFPLGDRSIPFEREVFTSF